MTVQQFNHRLTSPLAISIVSVLGVTLAGCTSTRLGRVPRGFQGDREAGVAVVGEDFSLSSNTTVASTKPVHFTIKSNRQPAGHAVYPDYRAYLHPPAAAGLTPKIEVTFSDPVINVPDGWAYLVGQYPSGRTNRIRAIGQGTEIVIEIDNSGGDEVHRVYFVSGKAGVQIFVPWTGTTPVYTMDMPGTYIESAAVNAFEFKGPYSQVAERAAFVKNVLAEIRAEGVR